MEDRLWVGGTQAATEPAAQNEKLAIKFLFDERRKLYLRFAA